MKLIVIADDFTGSNDTGVQFSKKGFNTVLSVYHPGMEIDTNNADVVVMDTESRFDTGQMAYEKTAFSVELLCKGNMPYIYKKIDSTLRGNIGAEIQGAMDASGVKLAVVSPAFPKNGRTVKNGVLLVNNVPVGETEVSKDPKTPVAISYIPEILERETNKKIGHIELKKVIKGSSILFEKILELKNQGVEIIVIDAVEDNELSIIAEAISMIEEKIVMVGSAGLAEFVPKYLFPELKASAPNSDCRNFGKGNTVVIAGSVSDVMRKQVEYGLMKGKFAVIDVDLRSVINGNFEEENIRIVAELKGHLFKEKDVIIRSAGERSQVDYARKIGEKLGLSDFEVSERIAFFFGQLVRKVYNEIELKGLMLSGGDVAIKAATALNAQGIIIKDEIAPGIPYGFFTGIDKGNVPVITKAGSFGREDALIEVINYLE